MVWVTESNGCVTLRDSSLRSAARLRSLQPQPRFGQPRSSPTTTFERRRFEILKLDFKDRIRVSKTQVTCDGNLMWKKNSRVISCVHSVLSFSCSSVESFLLHAWVLLRVLSWVPFFIVFFLQFLQIFIMYFLFPCLLFFFFLCGFFSSSSFLLQFLQIFIMFFKFFFLRLEFHVAKRSPCQQSKHEALRINFFTELEP